MILPFTFGRKPCEAIVPSLEFKTKNPSSFTPKTLPHYNISLAGSLLNQVKHQLTVAINLNHNILDVQNIS